MGKPKKRVADINSVPEKADSSADLPENIDHNKHSIKLSNDQKMTRFYPVVKLKRLKPEDSILTPCSRVVQPRKAIVKPRMLSHVIDSYVLSENVDHNKHSVKLSNEQKMARFNPVVKLKRLKPQDSILTPYSRVVQPQKASVKPQMLSHVIDSYVVPENIDHNKHSVKMSNEQKMALFNPVVKLKRLKPQDSILTPYSRVVQPQKAIVKPRMLSHVIDSYVLSENIDHNKHSVKMSNEQKMALFNPVVKLKRLKPQDSILTPYSRVVQPQKAIVKPRMLSHDIDSYVTQEVTLKSVGDSSSTDVSENSNSEDQSESMPGVSYGRGCPRGKKRKVIRTIRRSLRQKDAGPALASAEPNWKQFFDSLDSQTTCIQTDAKKKSSRLQDQKPVKVIQHWTAKEQKQLDELLVKFPPEEIQSRRWEKIANCLENRTPGQVKNKVREYNIKLLKAGMPIPGGMPEKYLGKKYDHESDADYVDDEDEEDEDEDSDEEEVDYEEIYNLWPFDDESDEEDFDEDEDEEDDDEIFNQWLYDDESEKEEDEEEEEDDDENDNQCLLK